MRKENKITEQLHSKFSCKLQSYLEQAATHRQPWRPKPNKRKELRCVRWRAWKLVRYVTCDKVQVQKKTRNHTVTVYLFSLDLPFWSPPLAFAQTKIHGNIIKFTFEQEGTKFMIFWKHNILYLPTDGKINHITNEFCYTSTIREEIDVVGFDWSEKEENMSICEIL